MSSFHGVRMLRGVLAMASVVVVVAGVVAWNGVDRARRQEQLKAAEAALRQGRLASAHAMLKELSGDRPGDPEVLLKLGQCQAALGLLGKAEDTFGRIPLDSDQGAEAALMRLRILCGAGRLAEAEELLGPEFLGQEGPQAIEAHHLYATVLKLQGRLDEAKGLYRRAFDRFGKPEVMLRELWEIDHASTSGSVRAVLDRDHRRHPEDDRIWLGLAGLAIDEGRLDDAARWLDRCERARPDDPAVARIRLKWAILADDPAAADRAIDRLPANALPPGQVLHLSAWFSRHLDDANRERTALEAALEAGDVDRGRMLDRLAALAHGVGDEESVKRLRGEKAAYDRAFERYRELILGPSPGTSAEELADLSGTLGWSFEERRWAILAGGSPESAGNRRSETHLGDRIGPTLDDLRSQRDRAKTVAFASKNQPGPGDLIPPIFQDRAEQSGLRFRYESGREDVFGVVQVMGGGVALLDFDGDGWLDVYASQGGRFPPQPGSENRDRLFRNLGDGTFEDVSRAAGLGNVPGGYGFGAAVGDYDGDDYPDLFISRWQSCQLLRNRGDGSFEDATEPAGLAGMRGWPNSACFADLDGDGDLDLYVCHYLVFDPERSVTEQGHGIGPNEYNPLAFPHETDHLFRNDGGRFVDVSEEAGITGADRHGRGLGVVACDLDDDGRIDLYVANDMTGNFLFRNLGGLQFEEQGTLAGVDAGGDGGYQAGMGIACGDLDGDGRPDLAVTNFLGEGMVFYRNLGGGIFAEQSAEVGLLGPTRSTLGFGSAFLDANNDGSIDLAATNGHVTDQRPAVPFAMPTQLLLNDGTGRLVDVTGKMGADWTLPRIGRGLAVGDLDNDGLLDVILVPQDGPMAYLHNETERAGGSLTIGLQATGTARSAEGACVIVEAGGHRQFGWKVGGGSYLSASDPRLHFGLGEANRAEVVEVRWPSGAVDRFEDLPAGSAWTLREGDPRPRPMPGFEVDPVVLATP